MCKHIGQTERKGVPVYISINYLQSPGKINGEEDQEDHQPKHKQKEHHPPSSASSELTRKGVRPFLESVFSLRQQNFNLFSSKGKLPSSPSSAPSIMNNRSQSVNLKSLNLGINFIPTVDILKSFHAELDGQVYSAWFEGAFS